MTPTITDIKSRLIYNSRGSETIEVDIFISDIIGTASSPAGASVGKFEAVAFRNANCKDTVDYLNEYKTKLIGIDASDIYAVKDPGSHLKEEYQSKLLLEKIIQEIKK